MGGEKINKKLLSINNQLHMAMQTRQLFFPYTAGSIISSAHLKKKTKPNPGAVTSNQGKKYYSLNSPQVKHNLSHINRTSALGVEIILVGVVDGENVGISEFRKFRIFCKKLILPTVNDTARGVRKKKLRRRDV